MMKQFFLKKHLKVALLLLSFLLVLTISQKSTPDTYAQEPAWTTPVVISPNDGNIAWFPDIVSDLAGNVHIFWTSGRTLENQNYGYDTVIYCRVVDDKCENVTEVAARSQKSGGITATRPTAVVDSQGNLDLLYNHDSMIAHKRGRVDEATSASTWSSISRISGDGSAYYSDIAVDNQDTIHVIWSQVVSPGTDDISNLICPFCADIFYRQSKDGGRTWSKPVDITNTELHTGKPQILLDDENIYVFWEQGVEEKTELTSSMFVASYDGGMTWSTPVKFMFPSDATQRVTAGLDRLGRLVVVWGLVKTDGIYYQTSSDGGQSWSPPRQINGVLKRGVGGEYLDNYNMASDSAGHLHLVLVGRNPQTPSSSQPGTTPPLSVFHLEWDGVTWAAPEPIFTIDGGVPEWPRIAVTNGNQLHVTWFVRDNTGSVNHQVWYTRGQSEASALPSAEWKQQPIPSVAPTIEAAAAATSAIEVSTTPTLEPLSNKFNDIDASPETVEVIFTDYDDMMLLAKSLLPILLIVGLILIGRHRIRRL